MATPTATATTRSADDEQLLQSLTEPLRDIARGGLAGALAGVVVGVAGRLAMRFATILNEHRVGSVTENGNVIGDITLAGTLVVFMFGGIFVGLAMGVVWTAVGPWIPGTGIRRALASMPIAAALAGFFLIESTNTDFLVLDSLVPVLTMLVSVVAIGGFSIALADTWLDRRLPPASGHRAMLAYGALTIVGALLILPIVISGYYGPDQPPWVGLAISVTGIATVARWVVRSRGHLELPAAVQIAGRGGLAVAVTLGALRLAGEVRSILL